MIGPILDIFEINPTKFSNDANVRCEKNRRIRNDALDFGLEADKLEVSLTDTGKTLRRVAL